MRAIFIILMLIPCITHAETKFVVYQVQGNVSYTLNNVTRSLEIGQSFSDLNTVIHVAYKGRAVLICNNYSAISLQKPDSYFLKTLLDSCGYSSNSFTLTYLKFVWEELTQTHGSIEQNREHYMHNIGATVRGCPDIQFLNTFDSINYSSGSFFIKWINKSRNNQQIRIYDYTTDKIPLMNLKLSADSVNLITLNDKISKPGIYHWVIINDEVEDCQRHWLRIWDKKGFQLLCDSVKNFLPPAINDAERNYMLGFYLEYNHFYAEAYNYYKMAYAKNPADKIYKSTLESFRKMYSIF